jgi:primosomal protein N' (replication factor Y)
MVRIVVRGPRERTSHALAEEIARRLKDAGKDDKSLRILGPAPAPIAKLRDNYRFQIQLHSPDGETLRNVVRQATTNLKAPEGVTWIVDVDPLDMM